MTFPLRVTEAVHSIVPTAKAFTIIISVSVGAFMAGVGAITGFGDTAANIALVPGMKETQDRVVDRMNTFELRLDAADYDRARILCLVTLTATGDLLTPLQVNERCP